MGAAEWLNFYRAEQLSRGGRIDVAPNNDGTPASSSASNDALEVGGEAELATAKQIFESACQAQLSEGLSLPQYALLLLNTQNDAVAPARDVSTPADESDLADQPLAKFFAATSHNSYIIGDQLTGESSAEACTPQG